MLLEAPEILQVAPGSRVELRAGDPASPLAGLWFREARASGGSGLLVSVVSGEVRRGDLRIAAGTRARFVPGQPLLEALTREDHARIEGWRARRLEQASVRRYGPRDLAERSAGSAAVTGDFLRLCSPGSLAFDMPPACLALSAEVRAVKGHLFLRYPVPGGTGEVALGNLPAWEDGGWHRLGFVSGPSGVEVFLDGRRLLKAPLREVFPGEEVATLGVRGGSLDVRAVAFGEEGSW
jgi:hypothetical protein